MKRVTFKTMEPGQTYVFSSTRNVKIFRQLGFIKDEVKRYVAVPATDTGYVAISLTSRHLEKLAMLRYVLHRPAAIEIEMAWDSKVEFDTMDYAEVKRFALGRPEEWEHIVPSSKW